MSWTKNDKFICDGCRKFASEPFDSYTPYGCANPADPEPYDPVEYCEKCAKQDYEFHLTAFKDGKRSGNWMKSNAESRAAKECGLVWVHNPSLKHKETGREIFNEYILERERDQYEYRYPQQITN
jgi:hypothetical protein